MLRGRSGTKTVCIVEICPVNLRIRVFYRCLEGRKKKKFLASENSQRKKYSEIVKREQHCQNQRHFLTTVGTQVIKRERKSYLCEFYYYYIYRYDSCIPLLTDKFVCACIHSTYNTHTYFYQLYLFFSLQILAVSSVFVCLPASEGWYIYIHTHRHTSIHANVLICSFLHSVSH